MSTTLFTTMAWDLSPSPEDKITSTSAASSGTSATEPTAMSSWPTESSAPLTSGRWRINSGDLEEMTRVASGLDSTSRPASAPPLEHDGSSISPPLSRENFVDEGGGSVIGFPLSRGSSPLFRKQQQQPLHQTHHHPHHVVGCSSNSDFQMDHHLDSTAPSSPCTPSLHLHGTSGDLSAVSPTSSRSDEVAFQQQLSLEGAAAAPPLIARPSGGMASDGTNNNGSPSGGRFGLKLLVSNSMAGTLIGKGGTRICEIKDECVADIKVTPNGRFYPGTHERVVLVVGEPGSVQMACDRIVTTIYTAADTSLDITQRVLIPDAASGLIIGHDGVRLGDLRQEAGVASIQVSPRDMCTVAGERVVTLQGPMSAVIHGLTLIVDRMMEDTSASRYQNMSTIYRAVHLHLPPYAAPGMHDNGASPRHPNHPRLSPSYGGPSPHSQHDYHSPSTVPAAAASRGRDYGNNGPAQWEFGYGGGSSHRNMPLPSSSVHELKAHRGGGPMDHHNRSHTAPAAVTGSSQHFGGRHLRHDVGGGRRDFDFGEGDINKGHRRGGPVDLDDSRLRDYDTPSPADLGGRSGSREGYMHHSPRLPGPSPRDLDHMRQQQQQQHNGGASDGGRGFSRGGGGGTNNGYPASASPSEYLPLQQQRLRQQQDMLALDGRSAAAAAAAAAAFAQHHQQQHHRSLHEEPSTSSLLRRNSSEPGHGGGSGMISPPHGGPLRQNVVSSSSRHHGDSSGLSGMFEGISLGSPNGLSAPASGSSPVSFQQRQQGQAGGGGAGCIVHGELPVPDADVGIILGKGGATVRELQQLSGAKIMIARRNEFMPGTKHRLVTLAGPPLAVNMARFLIMRKIQTEKEKL